MAVVALPSLVKASPGPVPPGTGVARCSTASGARGCWCTTSSYPLDAPLALTVAQNKAKLFPIAGQLGAKQREGRD